MQKEHLNNFTFKFNDGKFRGDDAKTKAQGITANSGSDARNEF